MQESSYDHLRKKNNERYLENQPLLTEDYLQKRGIDENAIEVQVHKNNLIEELLEHRGIDKNALRTVEGRRGATLKHHLTARMIILCSLTLPMIIIPFWLMRMLSPANIKHYSEHMQVAFMGALATDVIGLYAIITRNLFPQANNSLKRELDSEEDETDTEANAE